MHEITTDTVIKSKKSLKELTPAQLIALKDSKVIEPSTKEIIIQEYNRRLVEGGNDGSTTQ